MRRKLVIMAEYWALQTLVVYLGCAYLFRNAEKVDPEKHIAWPHVSWSEWVETMMAGDYLLWTAGATGAMVLVQAAFLWPVRKPTTKEVAGPSVFISLAAAGLMVAGLATAAVTAACQFLDNYSSWKVMRGAEVVGLGVLGMSWVGSTFLIMAFCKRGTRETTLQRLASRLLLGTIVEIAAIIPLDALVRKRESCYCWAGTYFALLACGGVGLVVLGPAVFLPLVIRRRKRWYAGRCEACGYDMSANLRAERCPECGVGWKPEARASALG